MDQDDDHHELYRLNKPVVSSCPRGHNYIIDQQLVVPRGGNNIIATNTSSTMFRTDGPSVLFDNIGHDIVDHNNNNNNNKMIRNNNHLMKSQIANHPCYPDLLAAYIQCQKIGAPPETASLLEEIDQENHMISSSSSSSTTGLGSDPELDYFMESYCEVLQRLKEELCKPFNEATTFLNKIESQLSKLREGTFTKTTLVQYYGDHSGDDQACDHHGGDEEDHQTMVMSYGDQVDHDHNQAAQILDSSYGGVGLGSGDHDELKEKLLRKYSGYLTTLKTEFLKKRKKVELPKPARSALLHWWNAHSRWPYPTEEEKAKLSEVTGLDQKQINNWFVNQRKRHWKPSDDIKSALVDDLTNHNNSPTKSPHNL